MELTRAHEIVAETVAHAQRKVVDQEHAIAPMKLGDPRLPKALVALQTLRENLAAAELLDVFRHG